MKRLYHHVVGTTQYLGTCKLHIFLDCPQLQKKRIAHMAWGDSDSTGCTHSDWHDARPHQVCKICVKREAKTKNPGPTETTSGTGAVSQQEDYHRV
jgi:hypothetical protein